MSKVTINNISTIRGPLRNRSDNILSPSTNLQIRKSKSRVDILTGSDPSLPEILSATKNNYASTLKILKENFDKKWDESHLNPSPTGSLLDYSVKAIIGAGSYGTVKLIHKSSGNKYYAVKILLKEKIIKNKQIANVYSEKRVLQCTRFPFLINLEFSLKDNDCVYLGLPFISGGELFHYHRKNKRFNENVARFYAAQVCLTIEYLHNCNLIYRDLKPENILIDDRGYLKLTDFGFCKKIESRTWTFCGTPEYIAPEIIECKGYSFCIDWWAFGVFIYELVAGVSPFLTQYSNTLLMYTKITKGDYKMPSIFSNELKDLVKHLLEVDTSRRYGNLRNGVNDIKNHSWFSKINWIKLLLYEIRPQYIPPITDPGDFSQFDKFQDIQYKKSKKEKYTEEFKDF